MNSAITWKDILLIILFSIVCGLSIYNVTTKNDLTKAENNIEAIKDTVKTYKLKNDELLYAQQGFLLEKAELEKYIGISKKTINELEKELDSKIALISKLEGNVRIDTLEVIDSIFIDNDTLFNNFVYQDNWLYLNGLTKYYDNISNTTINTIAMSAPITIGTTKDNQWFVTSENPYITFTDIKGANLEKAKPKRWALGVQVGLGVIGGAGICGSSDNIVRSGWVIGFGPYIGIGISYKLFEL